jgi:GrpB-like predicted nucleotidyltransferase (UPF0157 family)
MSEVFVGGRPKHNGTLVISDYDPAWRELYRREEERIRAALGGAVVRIEHAGSTSVPGLAAKPLIDIVLVVADTTDEDAYVAPLEAAGYRLTVREPDWFEHRLLKGPDTNINLHVFPVGAAEIERMLTFRDWLRTDDADRELYERTKRELAAREWEYVQDYADAKTAVVQEIVDRAVAATREPYTDEALDKAWVDGVPTLNSTVHLAEYNPAWPALFEREAGRIRSLLGDLVLTLEHVGSTSVPGLAAKPIVDIVLVVPDSSDEAAYLPALQGAGYRLVIREPEWHEHRALKGPDTNVNLHVYTSGSAEIDRYLVFRDRLRSHDEERDLYERTKRELAAREWKYIQHYADAKTEVVGRIVARALAER